jgi:hypothetical protein
LGDGLLLGRLTGTEITDSKTLRNTAALLAVAYLDRIALASVLDVGITSM